MERLDIVVCTTTNLYDLSKAAILSRKARIFTVSVEDREQFAADFRAKVLGDSKARHIAYDPKLDVPTVQFWRPMTMRKTVKLVTRILEDMLRTNPHIRSARL